MKSRVITTLFCITLAALVSCKKQRGEDTAALVGNWELRKNQSGMTPTITYAPGNGNIIQFTTTTYAFYSGGRLLQSGSYKLLKDTKDMAGECLDVNYYRLVYDNNLTTSKRLQLTAANKLVLLSGCFALDSGVYLEYEK